jgi:hypothetical protein
MEAVNSVRRTRMKLPNRGYSVSDSSGEALVKVKMQNLPVPAKPIYEIPPLPDDITELGDSALMSLFRRLMGWQKYLATQLALAEVDEKHAKNRLGRVEKGFDFRKPADKERAASDPLYEDCMDLQQEAYAYKRVVEALHGTVENDTFFCSRELSRRLGMADRDRREARYNA